MKTNIFTNDLFVIPEEKRAKMLRSARLFHRQELWLKQLHRMKHWFWFCGDMVDSSDYICYSSEINKWCRGVGINRSEYIIDTVVRISYYSHDWYKVDLEYDHQPANEYHIDPAYGTIGFASQDNADLFRWAWVGGDEVMDDEFKPVEVLERWHEHWKRWYSDRPLPISLDFSMR